MQTNAKAGNPELPKFEGVIRMEVSIDSIYNKLVSEFPEDYKHKEMVAHAVIGVAMHSSGAGMGAIYNALAGFTNQIDFEVGDIIVCTETYRKEKYDANKEDKDGNRIMMPKAVAEDEKEPAPNWKYRSVEIGKCKVIEIDLYRTNKLKVEFQSANEYNSGIVGDKEEWVSHNTCKMWAKRNQVQAVASR